MPGARSTRDGDTGNEDDSSFAGFLNLTNMPCSVLPCQAAWQVIHAMFSFAMSSGLASDSDKFKIIITLCRAQKFGDTGRHKNFDFLFNPLLHDFFHNFSRNLASHKWDAMR